MCSICGCGHGEVRIEGSGGTAPIATRAVAAHSHAHAGHRHDHQGHQHHGHDHHEHAHPAAGAHSHPDEGEAALARLAPDTTGSSSRRIEIEESILSENQRFADGNRSDWSRLGVLALNLISSPGAGKTSLLVKTLEVLRGEMPLWVIEGDQETSNDAERIRQTGVPAVQINTGRGCHLDAHMVGHATESLHLCEHGALFIENIGNLVCPAGFDLGETKRVVILSVTEGADKPIKYPDAFAGAHVMVLSKTDLLPYVDFDVAGATEMARRVNPDIEIVSVSTTTAGGIEPWLQWLRRQRQSLIAQEVAAIERRLADLRGQLVVRC